MSIKEINNLEGANKLGPSLKRRKETEGKKRISLTPFALNSKSKVILASLSLSLAHDKELLH